MTEPSKAALKAAERTTLWWSDDTDEDRMRRDIALAIDAAVTEERAKAQKLVEALEFYAAAGGEVVSVTIAIAALAEWEAPRGHH